MRKFNRGESGRVAEVNHMTYLDMAEAFVDAMYDFNGIRNNAESVENNENEEV